MNVLILVISLFFFKLSFSQTLDEKCASDNHTLRIYFWDKQPYIYESAQDISKPEGFFVIIIREALNHCCLAATNIRFVKENSGPAGLKGLLEGGMFDLVMPVHGFPDSLRVHGFPFVGIVESAGAAVLMLSNASGGKLLLSVLKAWPILVFIIVSALLAGVLMWFLVMYTLIQQFI